MCIGLDCQGADPQRQLPLSCISKLKKKKSWRRYAHMFGFIPYSDLCKFSQQSMWLEHSAAKLKVLYLRSPWYALLQNTMNTSMIIYAAENGARLLVNMIRTNISSAGHIRENVFQDELTFVHCLQKLAFNCSAVVANSTRDHPFQYLNVQKRRFCKL